MQELVDGNEGQQQDPPAAEIPKVEVKTEMTKRSGKKERAAPLPVGKPNPLADFSKEIIGQKVTFLCKPESGIEEIVGVPMIVLQDPSERWFVKFFASDGSRAFLYLDQIVTFLVHGENTDPIRQPGGPVIDMGSVDPSRLQGQSGDYYSRLSGEQLPDGITSPDRRSGLRDPGSVKRVPRMPQGPQQ